MVIKNVIPNQILKVSFFLLPTSHFQHEKLQESPLDIISEKVKEESSSDELMIEDPTEEERGNSNEVLISRRGGFSLGLWLNFPGNTVRNIFLEIKEEKLFSSPSKTISNFQVVRWEKGAGSLGILFVTLNWAWQLASSCRNKP